MSESNQHPDYITVYKAIGGWQSVRLTWCSDYGGFYEPEQTGFGPYDFEDEAVLDAKSWAADKGIEYRPRKEKG